MRISFFPLFRVRLRHRFYRSGRSEEDFVATPSAPTARLMYEHGVRFLARKEGFSVFAEIDPATRPKTDTAKPRLKTLDGKESLRLHFCLHGVNRYFQNLTDLPAYRPGAQVFYFNNLEAENEAADGGLQLKDSVSKKRFGPPLELVTSADYSYRFANPVHSGTLTVTDLFGGKVLERSFAHPTDVDPPEEELLELGKADGAVPGRYTVSHDQGGSRQIFYAPEAFGEPPFGVIEIFTSTLGLTAAPDKVPTQYRVFENDRIRRVGDFNIQFEPRKTIWRYNVTKKYEVPSPGIDVGSLTIDDAEFDRVVDNAGKPKRATFSSKAARALSEIPAGFELKHNTDKRIRKLPNPAPEAPLKIEGPEAAPIVVSDLFIYI